MRWKGKDVAIIGFGVEGQAMAEFLLREGAKVTVCDERDPEALGDSYHDWQGRDVRWRLGPQYLSGVEGAQVIVRSPGVRMHRELEQAKAAGVRITSQTKLFLDLCPSPIIGVTGTKGKGTTTTLIAKMLEASKKKVFVVGNIGVPAITVLSKLTPKHMVVYELSSFQLHDLTKSPQIAVMLGLTIDHQDYHKSPQEYFEAKANIFKHQSGDDAAIFMIDYPETQRLAAFAKGRVFHTSRSVPVEHGAYVAGDIIYRRINNRTEHVLYKHEVALKGEHNLENVTAAIVAASLAGATLPAIRQALKTFAGLPHRLEFVADVGGVEYWNNSYATMPDAALAGVRSFTQPVILLLGGSEKGLSYDQFADGIAESTVKTIVAIGANAPKIYELIKKAAVAKGKKPPAYVEGGSIMKDMVKAAKRFAKPGDVVLLSPAAASFDKFKNASDRGDQFKAVIK